MATKAPSWCVQVLQTDWLPRRRTLLLGYVCVKDQCINLTVSESSSVTEPATDFASLYPSPISTPCRVVLSPPGLVLSYFVLLISRLRSSLIFDSSRHALIQAILPFQTVNLPNPLFVWRMNDHFLCQLIFRVYTFLLSWIPLFASCYTPPSHPPYRTYTHPPQISMYTCPSSHYVLLVNGLTLKPQLPVFHLEYGYASF